MSSSKPSVDKQLLSNHLRHAESHNKVKEEREMWQQRELEKRRDRPWDDWSLRSRADFHITPLVRGRLISDSFDYSSPSPHSSSSSSPRNSPRHRRCSHHSSNYWSRELMRLEESDPSRWGHSGYKEHHPDEFVSSCDSDEVKVRKKKKKKMKEVSSSKKKRKKKEASKPKLIDNAKELSGYRQRKVLHKKRHLEGEAGFAKRKRKRACSPKARSSGSDSSTLAKRRKKAKHKT